MSSWTGRVMVALALTGPGTGCTGGGPGHPVVIRDSVGITIVESSAPLFGETPPWVVDSVPVLDIGADQGDPHQQLTRIAGPVMLSDGRIVVGDGGTQELRVFDSTGTWLETWGRKGQGPGEFEDLALLFRGPADTLVVFEFGNANLSGIGPRGEFLGRVRLPYPIERRTAAPAGVFSDGRLLVEAGAFALPGQSVVLRDEMPVYLASRDGKYDDSLGTVPGSEALVFGDERSFTVYRRPYGEISVVTVHGGGFYVGTSHGFELELRDGTGRVTRIIRRRFEPEPVTRAQMERFVSWQIDRYPKRGGDAAELHRKRLLDAPLPAIKPPYVAAVVASSGVLWVEEFAEPWVARRTYSTFDSTGRWLGRVPMPAGFQPTAITTAGVLGIWRDEDGVPHVRRYRMRASAR